MSQLYQPDEAGGRERREAGSPIELDVDLDRENTHFLIVRSKKVQEDLRGKIRDIRPYGFVLGKAVDDLEHGVPEFLS